jgi:type IV pilus assembly protein PilV
MSSKRTARPVRGFTLIEVLVTIVVVVIGVLGVFAMQTQAAKVELESYQRGQAISLVREMSGRISSSRGILAGYANAAVSSTDGSIYQGNGAGASNFDTAGACVLTITAPATTPTALQSAQYETCLWASSLLGDAARDGTATGARVGAMLGARGCLIRVNPPNANALADMYVVVVWQGLIVGNDPPAGSPGAECASAVNYGTGLRRAVSLRVLVPDLTKGA